MQTLSTIYLAFTSHHSCKLHTSIDFRECTGEERKANSLDPKALVVPSQGPKKRTKKLGQGQCASLILNLSLLPRLQPDPQLLFPLLWSFSTPYHVLLTTFFLGLSFSAFCLISKILSCFPLHLLLSSDKPVFLLTSRITKHKTDSSRDHVTG